MSSKSENNNLGSKKPISKTFTFIILCYLLTFYLGCSSCEKITLPETNFWKLKNGWYYSPKDLKNRNTVCKGLQEYYYLKVKSQLSHVALKTLKKQNQDNIESSCKNNALLSGKSFLYKKMLQGSPDYEKKLNKLISYNKTKEQTGVLDCKSLPSRLGTEPYLECECILYAYYPDGQKGVSK